MTNEVKDDYLKAYKEYLEGLANNQSSALFANAGKEHARILMSLLFNHTVSDVRIFCVGFRPALISEDPDENPYWISLQNYLDSGKRLKVLVETDEFIDKEPLQLLKKVKKNRKNAGSIVVKKITDEDKKLINEKVEGEDCNFAIFDNNKFRFEYDPVGFKAYGSFNRPENCRYLIDVFDAAFKNSNTVLV